MRKIMAPIAGRDDAELRKIAKAHFPGMLGTNRVRKDGVLYYAIVIHDDDLTDPEPWYQAMSAPRVAERPRRAWRRNAPVLLAVAATGVGCLIGGVSGTDFLPLVVAIPAVWRK